MKYATAIVLFVLADTLCKSANVSKAMLPGLYNGFDNNSNVSQSGIVSLNKYSCDTSKALPCVEKLTGAEYKVCTHNYVGLSYSLSTSSI